MPDAWHMSLVAAVFKKGDVHKCDNYRPISLLAVCYKLFACIPLRRLKDAGSESRIWESQTGFRFDPASWALLLSQGGEAAGCAFTVTPSSPDTAVPNAEYRVLLFRRLRLPLPLAPKHCACGGLLDDLGDHRSACAQVGALARRAGLLCELPSFAMRRVHGSQQMWPFGT